MPPGRSGTSVMSTLRSGNRIEPGTSRTLSENYTPKPTSQEKCDVTDVRTPTTPRTKSLTDTHKHKRKHRHTMTNRQADRQMDR